MYDVPRYDVPRYAAPTQFSLRKSGRCAPGTWITSYAQCNAASRELQLPDPIVQNDNQPKGVSYDPKGCYYEGGVLKFNTGNRNTGACSSSDNCLCLKKGALWVARSLRARVDACNRLDVNGKPL